MESASLVFLDFDGVLNSATYQRAVAAKLTDAEFVTRSSKLLDVAAIERLNRLLAETGAKVVVSSTWRIGMTVPELQALLEGRGFNGVVYGVTPNLHSTRCAEIQAWLDQHGSDGRFVILDDADGMDELTSRHVRTDLESGLTDADCMRAIELLSSKST